MATVLKHLDTFDPAAWLTAMTQIGGGYALMSGRRLALMVDDCHPEDLTTVMAPLVGRPDRQEAIKAAIERKQLGAVA
ncbi:hypothetical protein J2Y58_002484 [Sphingomonas sp. BE138]|uniref:hypothetical protein n=1 Tax=Sphingomonas sp. BE138 TaxID=2817845 RepID=UPI00285EC919|nr:hypothetical protein [Sphingomonas sp. BE138]MDR6789115.1 hypothetical protein [Sphingomonas sp. BE138]